jgi:hypothetical protein
MLPRHYLSWASGAADADQPHFELAPGCTSWSIAARAAMPLGSTSRGSALCLTATWCTWADSGAGGACHRRTNSFERSCPALPSPACHRGAEACRADSVRRAAAALGEIIAAWSLPFTGWFAVYPAWLLGGEVVRCKERAWQQTDHSPGARRTNRVSSALHRCTPRKGQPSRQRRHARKRCVSAATAT